MAVGNVYYFNATPNSVELLNNNHVLNAHVPGVQQSSNYAPTANEEPRNPATESENATFGKRNKFVVSYADGTSQEYDLTIDPEEIYIDENVQLYIFFNQVVLVSPNGSGHSVVVQGKQLSADEAEA